MSEHQRIPGLPGPLPEGEHLLWRGSPSWKALAIRTFHGRLMACYFALLLAWVVVSNLAQGATVAQTAWSFLWFAALAAAGLGLVMLLAWLTARTTTYVVTDRRVVFCYGIAMPMSLNLPFARVASAGVRTFADGSADIPLAMAPGDIVAYLMLWPHARPWRISKPEPALRAVPEGQQVASILARALAASAKQPVQAMAAQQTTAGMRSANAPTIAAA